MKLCQELYRHLLAIVAISAAHVSNRLYPSKYPVLPHQKPRFRYDGEVSNVTNEEVFELFVVLAKFRFLYGYDHGAINLTRDCLSTFAERSNNYSIATPGKEGMEVLSAVFYLYIVSDHAPSHKLTVKIATILERGNQLSFLANKLMVCPTLGRQIAQELLYIASVSVLISPRSVVPSRKAAVVLLGVEFARFYMEQKPKQENCFAQVLNKLPKRKLEDQNAVEPEPKNAEPEGPEKSDSVEVADLVFGWMLLRELLISCSQQNHADVAELQSSAYGEMDMIESRLGALKAPRVTLYDPSPLSVQEPNVALGSTPISEEEEEPMMEDVG